MTATISADTTSAEQTPDPESEIINEIKFRAANAAHDEWMIEMLAKGYEPGFEKNNDPKSAPLRNPSMFPYKTLVAARDIEEFDQEQLLNLAQLQFQNFKEKILLNDKFKSYSSDDQTKILAQIDKCIRLIPALTELDRDQGFNNWLTLAKGSEASPSLADKNEAWSNSAEIIYKSLSKTESESGIASALKAIKESFERIDSADDIHEVVKQLTGNWNVSIAIRNIHNQWKASWFGIDNLNILTLDDGTTVDTSGMSDSQIDSIINENLNNSSALLAYASRLHLLESGMQSKTADELRLWLEDTLNENHRLLTTDSTLPSSISFYTLIDTAKLISNMINKRSGEPDVVKVLEAGLQTRIAEIQKDASVALIQVMVDVLQEKG